MTDHFPMKRVKTIMKSSSEVENISKESVVLVARAAEQFIKLLIQEAYTDSNKGKKMEYKNIANIVNHNDRYEFLREMIPHKITVEEYYQIMKGKCGNDSDEVASDGSSDDEECKEKNDEKNGQTSGKAHDSSSGSDSDVIMLD